jgi:hypothetical protein
VTALLSLSALGYFIGWREASAYYGKLGAPWAVLMLPPFALLQLSPEIAVLIGIVAFLGFEALATGQVSAQSLRRWTLIILMIAIGLYYASSQLSHWLTAWEAYFATRLVAWAFAISAGLTVAELLGHLKLAGWQMKPTHMVLIFGVVWFGLLVAPDQLGQARALYHLDPATTELPLVELRSSPPDLKSARRQSVDRYFTRSAILWASRRTNHRFKFYKRGQQFIRLHNETLSVAAMRVNNPDCSRVGQPLRPSPSSNRFC